VPTVLRLALRVSAHAFMNYIVVGCRRPIACWRGSSRFDAMARHGLVVFARTCSTQISDIEHGRNRSLCVSLAVQPGWSGVRRCACFEVAKCDGIWPGSQVAQPRKTPPDLGTQLYTMSRRSSSINIHQCRTYALSVFVCLRIALKGDTVIWGSNRHPVHALTEMAVIWCLKCEPENPIADT
jgi:hypothetical protein